jgi:hypothetical protein
MRKIFAATLATLWTATGGCGSRTGLNTDHSDAGSLPGEQQPPTITCEPAESWTTVGRAATVFGRGTDDGWIVGWAWEVTERPADSQASVFPVLGESTTIVPDQPGNFLIKLTATDNDDLASSCEAVVHSVVGPPVPFCPDDIVEAVEGQQYTLEGGGFDDVEIVSYHWEVTLRPEDSLAMADSPDTATTTFTPDQTGRYELTLTVTDNDENSTSCVTAVVTFGPPDVECPPDTTAPTRQPLELTGTTSVVDEPLQWQWEIVEAPDNSSTALEQATTATTILTPDRAGTYQLRLTLTNEVNLSGTCETTVEATPTPPDVTCPGEITTTPLVDTEVVGRAEDDGTIVSWQWTIVSQPPGSSADAPTPANRARTTLMADVVGEYELELTVADDHGNEVSCTTTVVAVPAEGLRVELYWNPPDRSCDSHVAPCDPSDVDLHLLHPDAPAWFSASQAGDCYYANCVGGLNWDGPGVEDNPRLDLDDVDGFGPENINITEPVVGNTYTVGVHYFTADGRSADTEAYVRIYCGTIATDPVYEVGPVTIEDHGSSYWNDFWRVATIEWDGIDCAVTPLVGDGGGPDIVSAREAENRR